MEKPLRRRPIVTAETSKNPRSVFVVHGRNDSLRSSVFDFLRSVNLKPMEWTQAVALTGQGAPYIGQILDSAFGHAQAIVVLFTPDEVAYLQPRFSSGDDDPDVQPAAQARPNVLFEAGMALGREPERTVMVEIGQVRSFSDVAGRHVVRLDNSSESRQAFARRLETAGCDVDLTGTDWLNAGDFTPPSHPADGLALGRRVPSAPPPRSSIDFDLKYLNKGGKRVDKLQVINRGRETAYGVSLAVPKGAALGIIDPPVEIEKIPGGRSVTIDVMNDARRLAGGMTAFDVTVAGTTESGERVSKEVFIDLNG